MKRLSDCTGYARAHLQTWVAAATCLQLWWKAKQFRKRMKRGQAIRSALLHSIVRIQALWRARQAKSAFKKQRMAAIMLQARNSSLSFPQGQIMDVFKRKLKNMLLGHCYALLR